MISLGSRAGRLALPGIATIQQSAAVAAEERGDGMMARVLVLGEETSCSEETRGILESRGFQITLCKDKSEGLRKLFARNFDLLVVDLQLPVSSEMEFFRLARLVDPNISVIMVTAEGTIASTVRALKGGVSDYLQRPYNPSDLVQSIERTFREKQVLREIRLVRPESVRKHTFSNIISKSPKMQYIFEIIKRVAGTDSTVFITGETGVGKELVAKAIHDNSPRRDGPFLAINCGSLTETLLESELFGHEKGAFTGAFKTKHGKFECANNGTLFLDELGDITSAMQVKLLRALQERKVVRVGGNDSIAVDVRVISATNQDIKEKIRRHEFRLDLFYRLNVIHIHVPPLRERQEDIPLLVQHFIKVINENLGRKIKGVSTRGMKQLLEYEWPGNIRELENVLERACITCDGDVIDQFVFPHDAQNPAMEGTDETVDTDVPFDLARHMVVAQFEKRYLTEALRRYEGNVSETAKRTGIHQRTLWRKVREHRLDRMQFKKSKEL
ncbi:MAG: sigma-54-dependent Fis family transcriptional regulator [Deltaproteobacteria bacterium]|nr:sigma-54-dependent Fis family transcriptional regulator [Deltaproteobacteria bacterium]